MNKLQKIKRKIQILEQETEELKQLKRDCVFARTFRKQLIRTNFD